MGHHAILHMATRFPDGEPLDIADSFMRLGDGAVQGVLTYFPQLTSSKVP